MLNFLVKILSSPNKNFEVLLDYSFYLWKSSQKMFTKISSKGQVFLADLREMTRNWQDHMVKKIRASKQFSVYTMDTF